MDKCSPMEKYTVVRVLGEGAYGEVLQAVHNTTVRHFLVAP